MKKSIFAILLLAVLIISSTATLAAPINTPDGKGLRLDSTNGLNNEEAVFTLIDRVANWLFAILITVAVIYVLMAAYTYLTSGGGEGVEKGHKMLMWAAIAIAVAILAKGFVNVVRIFIINK